MLRPLTVTLVREDTAALMTLPVMAEPEGADTAAAGAVERITPGILEAAEAEAMLPYQQPLMVLLLAPEAAAETAI